MDLPDLLHSIGNNSLIHPIKVVIQFNLTVLINIQCKLFIGNYHDRFCNLLRH